MSCADDSHHKLQGSKISKTPYRQSFFLSDRNSILCDLQRARLLSNEDQHEARTNTCPSLY